MMILVLALLVATGLVFVSCAPQLGAVGKGNPVLHSANFKNGKFHNSSYTSVGSSSKEMLESTIKYFMGSQGREPSGPIPTILVAPDQIGNTDELRVTWLGHSTCLIEIDGQVILTDPIFSDRSSPIPFMGPKRFASKLPISLEDLPQLDVVVISHDHYDHLDYRTIQKLKNKTERFYVPLGVGDHLKRWGVASGKIVELDWWKESWYNGLTIVATPARHFSGRSFLRSDRTLWSSWVIMSEKSRVFFSGDSGYFKGFKKIGDKYGPFDITLLESGAYNEAWAEIHMMPEETVQAHIDLHGRVLLPIHWAKFNLSLHSWTEPVERLLAEAEIKEVKVAAPLQGQSVYPGEQQEVTRWWIDHYDS